MKLGVLLIGQTPRPDLTSVLGDLRADIQVRGALDLADAFPLQPPGDVFPLSTRLRDGQHVVVDEPFLSPLLQRHVLELETTGAHAIVLLCAGPFSDLTSGLPLVRPFDMGCRVLHASGLRRPLCLVPIPEQVKPAERKWRAAGFDPLVVSFHAADSLPDLVEQHLTAQDAVVFDYVGFPETVLNTVRERSAVPVLDLGHLAAAVLRSMMA